MNVAPQDAGSPRESPTWHSPEPPPDLPPPGLAGWALVLLRGAAILPALGIGLCLLLPARLIERGVSDGRHRVSARITQAVCRWSLWCLGFRLHLRGRPAAGRVVILANHSSWLDILVLNAVDRVTFVAKAEVASWPGIGLLARATGTVFIRRLRRDARVQADLLSGRIAGSDRLVLFPEGTSTDGARVLPFRPSLFAALVPPQAPPDLTIQPVTLVYRAPPGVDPRFHAWWGEMALGPHLVRVLSARPQGDVTVTFAKPLASKDYSDRKALARAARDAVQHGIPSP